MYSLIYPQDSKLFRFCQVRNQDIDMSYVALPYKERYINILKVGTHLEV